MFSAIRARLRPSSLSARLTFWYILTLGSCLAGFSIFVFLMRAQTLYREVDAELTLRVHQLAEELRPALLGLDISSSLASEAVARETPLLVREIPDAPLFRSPAFPQLNWRAERALVAAIRARQPIVGIDDPPRAALRIATLVIERPGAHPIALQVAASTEPVQRVLGQLAGTMILAIMLVLALASYGSRVTAQRALTPVEHIVARVRRIQASNLTGRLDRADSEEIDRLVVTLNEMLGRIEASVRSARRFAADASHELQTPIAIMRSIVEASLRGRHEAANDEAIGKDLLAEIDRMSVLVKDLRLFTSADAGQLENSAEAVDLGALADDCAEIARALAEEKRIQVETTIADHPTVVGSAFHLRRAILNLAQNAIRYSPEASTISIAVERKNGYARLAVGDRGCGIDKADLPHIFEPFYRADPARARETGGTGLGLAIVDQIVRAHGGAVDVTSTLGKGSLFTISLPCIATPTPPARHS